MPDRAAHEDRLDALAARARACRVCRDAPRVLPPLPVEPNPILRVSRTARILIASQAPGSKAHESGRPFFDPSGVRLREWMGLTLEEFHDPALVAIVPMGFCYPGRGKGGDLPPRPECAPLWHAPLLDALPQMRLTLLVGWHSMRHHLGKAVGRTLTETAKDWPRVMALQDAPRLFPLPHPSPRNNIWLRKNPWFEAAAVPALQEAVAAAQEGRDVPIESPRQ